MVDTIRQRSELLTLLADNTSGAISPQDLRDFVVTALGGYGGVYVSTPVSAFTCTSSTERTFPAYDATTASSDVVAAVPASTLTLPVAGDYLVMFDISGSFDSNIVSAEFKVAKNGTATSFTTTGDFTTSGTIYAVGTHGIITCAADDVLSVRVETDTTADFTISSGTFACAMLG